MKYIFRNDKGNDPRPDHTIFSRKELAAAIRASKLSKGTEKNSFEHGKVTRRSIELPRAIQLKGDDFNKKLNVAKGKEPELIAPPELAEKKKYYFEGSNGKIAHMAGVMKEVKYRI